MNIAPLDANIVWDHLIVNGICQNYAKWIWNDELSDVPRASTREEFDIEMSDHLEEMTYDRLFLTSTHT